VRNERGRVGVVGVLWASRRLAVVAAGVEVVGAIGADKIKKEGIKRLMDKKFFRFGDFEHFFQSK